MARRLSKGKCAQGLAFSALLFVFLLCTPTNACACQRPTGDADTRYDIMCLVHDKIFMQTPFRINYFFKGISGGLLSHLWHFGALILVGLCCSERRVGLAVVAVHALFRRKDAGTPTKEDRPADPKQEHAANCLRLAMESGNTNKLLNAISSGRAHKVPQALLDEAELLLKDWRQASSPPQNSRKRRHNCGSASHEHAQSMPVPSPSDPIATAKESLGDSDGATKHSLGRSSSVPSSSSEGLQTRECSPAPKPQTTGKKQIFLKVRAGNGEVPKGSIRVKAGPAEPPHPPPSTPAPSPQGSAPATPPLTPPPTPVKGQAQRGSRQSTPTPGPVIPKPACRQPNAAEKKAVQQRRGRSADGAHTKREAYSRGPEAQKRAAGAVAPPVKNGSTKVAPPPSAASAGQKTRSTASVKPGVKYSEVVANRRKAGENSLSPKPAEERTPPPTPAQMPVTSVMRERPPLLPQQSGPAPGPAAPASSFFSFLSWAPSPAAGPAACSYAACNEQRQAGPRPILELPLQDAVPQSADEARKLAAYRAIWEGNGPHPGAQAVGAPSGSLCTPALGPSQSAGGLVNAAGRGGLDRTPWMGASSVGGSTPGPSPACTPTSLSPRRRPNAVVIISDLRPDAPAFFPATSGHGPVSDNGFGGFRTSTGFVSDSVASLVW